MIDWSNRAIASSVVAVVFVSTYWGSAALAWRAPEVLRPSWLDRLIPVLPAAIWVYLSVIPLTALALWLPDRTTRWRIVVAAVFICILAGTVFLLYPTTIPRLEPLASGLTGFLWRSLYVLDTTNNAFPSLHAAFAMIAAAVLWRSGPFHRRIGALWSLAVLGSALAIKQHFVIDLLAGIVVGGLAYLGAIRMETLKA